MTLDAEEKDMTDDSKIMDTKLDVSDMNTFGNYNESANS